jgi:uncharacterized membrane protein (DUF4010 family)
MLDLALPTLLLIAQRLAIAGLVGAAVGIEREWSSPPSGSEGRFAGLRTFFLLGLLGGASGILYTLALPSAAAVLLAGGAALIIAAYVMKVRAHPKLIDGTTEMAALVVLGLTLLAGLGYLALAGGCVALVVLALGEKNRLHGWVHRIDQVEMRAGLQFLVLALVVLPLLPAGPYPALLGFQPRVLWMIVLLLSGLSFAGYMAHQLVGPTKGYGVTGIIGGFISSTAVTLQFSRLSRAHPKQGVGLALGVIGACTVLPLRVFVVSTALSLKVGWALIPYLLPVFLVGALLLTLGLRYAPAGEAEGAGDKSPLRFRAALLMALAFQLSMFALDYTRAHWGERGLIGSAIFLGLTDVDALTVSMSRMADGTDIAALAALGIAIGIASNTVFKLGIAGVVGTASFRRWTVGGLFLLLLTLGTTLWLNWPA